MKFAILFLLSSFALFGATPVKTFSLMSYNVENLFDTVHDPGKEDYTYLPLGVKKASKEVQAYCASLSNDYYRKQCLELDWSQDILDAKVKKISKVVGAAKGGKGPDILVVQEVENKGVLSYLVEKGLRGMGYEYISLLEGPDSRGVDVGIVSRFPIVKERSHLVDLEGVAKETRSILQVDIKLGDKVVSVFSNHWPSQSNPSEARLIAAETLLEKALASGADAVVAAGDFNTVAGDNPHGINLVIKPNFYLAREQAVARGFNVFKGTHWYRGEWGALDKILILKRSKPSIKPLYGTFEVFKKNWMLKKRVWTDYDTGQTTVHHVPFSFDEETGEGYADHLPLLMNFAY